MPEIVVVMAPEMPLGARERGIGVPDGKTSTGVPFMISVFAPGMFWLPGDRGIVVGPGITRYGVLRQVSIYFSYYVGSRAKSKTCSRPITIGYQQQRGTAFSLRSILMENRNR